MSQQSPQQQQKLKKDSMKITQPSKFSTKFWGRLTALEQIFYSQELQISHLQEILDLCGRAIEYYDSKKDPISHYFQDKIQYLLSRKEILHQLVNQKEDPGLIERISSKARTASSFMNKPSISGKNLDYLYDSNDTRFDKKSDRLNAEALSRESVQKRKNMVEYKVNVGLEQDRKNRKNQIKNIVDEQERSENYHNTLFEKDLQQQEDAFQQRLKQRKMKKKRRNSFNIEKVNTEQPEGKEELLRTETDEFQNQQELNQQQQQVQQKIDFDEMQQDIIYSSMRIHASIKKRQQRKFKQEEQQQNLLDGLSTDQLEFQRTNSQNNNIQQQNQQQQQVVDLEQNDFSPQMRIRDTIIKKSDIFRDSQGNNNN